MKTQIIRIGSRGSRLALIQAEWVAERLREAHPGLETRMVTIQTMGDRLPSASLADVGGKGVFTKEIERALSRGEIDLAVHSMKDMPAEDPEELRLVAYPTREDPADVLAGARPLDWKRAGATFRIATSSLRRQAQLLRANPSLRVEPIRGNVTTRLRHALEGECDAVALASAGLRRLGVSAPWVERLSFEDMLPAPCQGALGLQARADDDKISDLLRALNDAATEAACIAERAFLRRLGGGCRAPIAALGSVRGAALAMDGMVASPDGRSWRRRALDGDAKYAESIGRELAESLLAEGAGALISELMDAAGGGPGSIGVTDLATEGPLAGRKIIVTRDEDSDGPLSAALRALGGEPIALPLVEERAAEDQAALAIAATVIDRFDWIIFSSRRGVQALARALNGAGHRLRDLRATIACSGPRTAEFVRMEGGVATIVSREGGAKALLELIRAAVGDAKGARALHPASEEALPTLADGLRGMGFDLIEAPAYGMKPTGRAKEAATRMREGGIDAIVFASPSAAKALADEWHQGEAQSLRPAFASIGPTTSSAMREAGLRVDVEARERTFEGLAAALGEWLAARNPESSGATR